VLEDAGLVATMRRGREKLHYLNPVPIHEIYERWISKLTVTHDGFVPGLQLRAGITAGWPKVFSGLKTLLETGESLALA
jgi:hypothetical protein